MPAPWHLPVPASAAVAIWGVKQQVEDLIVFLFSLYCELCFFFSSKEILKQISMCGVLKVAMYLDRRKCYPIGSRGCRLILLGGRVGHPKHFILALGLL